MNPSKKLIVFLSTLSMLVAMSLNPVSAESYVGFKGLYVVDDSEIGFSGQLGFEFAEDSLSNESHAIELEIAWYGSEEQFGFVTIEADLLPVMLNYKYTSSYYDEYSLPVYFYGGGGVGFTYGNVDITGFGSDDDVVLSAQVFVGLGYEVSEGTKLEIGYRYLTLDDLSVFGAQIGDLDASIIEFGLKFEF